MAFKESLLGTSPHPLFRLCRDVETTLLEDTDCGHVIGSELRCKLLTFGNSR